MGSEHTCLDSSIPAISGNSLAAPFWGCWAAGGGAATMMPGFAVRFFFIERRRLFQGCLIPLY